MVARRAVQMLHRFTERARRVLTLADEETRVRHHALVAPEHVLLGMIRNGGGMAIHVLQRQGVIPHTLKTEVERSLEVHPRNAGR